MPSILLKFFEVVLLQSGTGGIFRAACTTALYALLDAHLFFIPPASTPLTGLYRAQQSHSLCHDMQTSHSGTPDHAVLLSRPGSGF